MPSKKTPLKLLIGKGKTNARNSPEWDVGGCSATDTGAVRVNQGRDGMSPVAASIYCSPHPAALQIDAAPGSGSFASMIPRPEN